MDLSWIKLPPHSIELERAVIRCLLFDNNIIWTTTLTPKHFYKKEYRDIFTIAVELFTNKMNVDVVSLSAKWVSEELLREITSWVYTHSWYTTHEQLLDEMLIYRDTIEQCNYLAWLCYSSPGVDEVKKHITKMASNWLSTSDWSYLWDVISEYINEGEEYKSEISFYGFEAIDEITNWIKQGQLVVLWAWTWAWKTLLAINVLHKSMEQWVKCCLFSTEMTRFEITERMFAMRSKQPVNELSVSQNMWCLPDYMQENMLTIFDNTFDLYKILASIRKSYIQDWTKLFVVDYLTLISFNAWNINKNEKIGIMTREFKVLAMELGVCIVLLSQLNRAWQKTEPTLQNLRDSWNIEQDANVVLLLHRDELNWSQVLIVAKNRNWKTGKIELDINYAHMLVEWATILIE